MNYFLVKFTKNLLEHKRVIQALTVFWTALVAYLCLVKAENLPSLNILKFDKIGHLTFHFGITVLWFLFLKTTFKNENKYALIKAFLFSFLFGVVIEFCQGYFTESRKADFNDVFANSAGSLLAVGIIYFSKKLKDRF